MAKRFREVIGLLEYEELVLLKEDLSKGGDGIRILVDNKIKEEIKKMNQFCAVCAAKIDPESRTRLSMTVGPEGAKREASFCAMDCLEYFLGEMKKNKKD